MKNFFQPMFTIELKRIWRRALVILFYTVFFALIFFWTSLPAELPNSLVALAQWLTLAGTLVIAGIYLSLNAATQGLADRFGRTVTGAPIDERQLLLRNQAYFWGYILLGPALLTLVFLSERLGLSWSVIAGFAFYVAFPTTVIAWLEPNPPTEESFPHTSKEIA